MFCLILCLMVAVQACNQKNEGRKRFIIGNRIDPILNSNDFLFDVFMEAEFKKSLDTLEIYSSIEPLSIALVEHECSSCYSMTSLKYLFMQYPDSANVYLFKYDYQNSSWVLKRDRSKAGTWSMEIDSIIKNRKDEISILSNNRFADLVRYGIIDLDTEKIDIKITTEPDQTFLNSFFE